ncbi:MAG: hypothetical protein HC906_01335 [Bacteroidales bacterium]|nr:hypothetical protein [Bacteroidales bacterium]
MIEGEIVDEGLEPQENAANTQEVVSDEEYQQFVEYLKNKDFDYTTKSDDQLQELIKTATQEKYFDMAKEEFDALKLKLAHDKNKDLQTFKDEIIELLTEEIISRYYYQEGRIQSGLKEDKDIQKALEILGNDKQYISILNPGNVNEKVAKAN